MKSGILQANVKSMDKRRRKSLNTMRPQLSPLTPINEPPDAASTSLLKKKRRPPLLDSDLATAASPTSFDIPSPQAPEIKKKSSVDRLMSRNRPKSLQKTGRPSSIFGSWRSSSQTHIEEDETALARTASIPSSIYSYTEFVSGLASSQVLLHGDVQTSSGVFRKKSQYLVLTDTHLIKLRSQSRASEVFPSIPSSFGRASGTRQSRLSSSSSNYDTHTSSEGLQTYPLNQIIAVYRLDDGKPYFSIEVTYLDEEVMQTASFTLQLYDPKDHDLWLSSIRGAAMNARLKVPSQFSQHLVEYTARILEQDLDYDPHQFHMFRVVQRSSKSSSTKSSSDDLTKMTSNVCILAIGIFRLHLIPLPKGYRNVSSTSLSEQGARSYGIASLTDFAVGSDDDIFVLKFRIPLRQSLSLSLASSCTNDIALSVRRTAEYLRPKWPEQPFTWNVSKLMDEDFLPVPPIDEEHEALDRTLAAYCVAYGTNASLIRYTVDASCEDGPRFCLALRGDGRKYSTLDLLAILRALRYNESFSALSFAGIDLSDLHKFCDPYGCEHVAWRTRSGEQLNPQVERNFTLLVQEIRALALNSVTLRRLDFSDCLNVTAINRPKREEDTGCGVCEGLFPICQRHATNIDWINLSGILLSETDLDYIFSTAIDRSCHFRAIEVGRCGLTERGVHTILNALSHQTATLESLDISGNPARHEIDTLNRDLASFSHLRKINLSRVLRISGANALLNAELLVQWRLEEIDLSYTTINREGVDALAVYLQSPQSSSLRMLNLEQCQLSGYDAATLFESSWTSARPARELRMDLSSNRLENGHEALVEAVRQGRCPTQVVMQMTDYHEEKHFRQLLDAVTVNKNITYLDLSRVMLASDASQATCESLGRIFAFNSALTYLDISGEQTHIVASNLGAGLNDALIGMRYNTCISTLRLENQRLGLQGASTLASVLESNKTLREVHCENNEVNLQAFTVLVNSLERNQTLLYLPHMEQDRAWAQRKVDREVDNLRENSNPGTNSLSTTKATVKRTLGRTMTGQKSNHQRVSSGPVQAADFTIALGSLAERWDQEVSRLQSYLVRNNKLALGLSADLLGAPIGDYPDIRTSLDPAFQDLSFQDTPRAELNRQLLPPEAGQEEGELEGGSDAEAEGEDAESPLEMRL